MSVYDLRKKSVKKVIKSGHESNKTGRFKLCNEVLILIRLYQQENRNVLAEGRRENE